MLSDELHSPLLCRKDGGGYPRTAASSAAANGTAADAPKEKKDKEKKVKEVKEKPKWGEPGAKKADKEAKKKEKAPAEPAAPLVVTPPGEKKDLSTPMAAGYDPVAVESAWYAWWEKKGFFIPNPANAKNQIEGKKFVMVIPPPNVTGSLHLGHTLTCAIEDSLTRWHRMCGNTALWVPGTDHAGIATQSVVERKLYKDEKITRHDLGREKFLERVWAWKEKNGNRICDQLRKISASVDWTRESFTMDKKLAKAVEAAFIRFHDQGLIYRENRLVHWCPHLRTALSDLEVDHEDIPGKTYLSIPGFDGKVEVGVLCEFKYMVKGEKDAALIVATTRLETMLGDSAVAVHPDDDRYKAYHGKELVHPFFPDRKMKVIADTMVDREFGTGCVKITPAHDHNDFKAGQRHKLEQINILSEDGTINATGGPFAGQHRFKARSTVEEALKEKGLWVGKKSHAMRLGLCSRSKDVIEPFQKRQWWMNCKELADKSVKAVREGELKIIPEFHHQTWYYWLENIQEWCISRQLWWGHRIPAYRVVKPDQGGKEVWFTGTSMADAKAKAEKKLGKKGVELEQDEDVLDTWFSSGLFPFSVFGWPDNTEDMDAFFPTSLLETGHDILFFWVARMVMMSIGLTGKLPFHTVYLHAMVRDAHGRKMSKSLGNVIDPLEVVEGISLEELHKKLYEGNLPDKEIEKAKEGQKQDFPDGIPQCGADALRFGLLAYTLQGRNVNLDINRVVGYRHFCNKIWNATKFALHYLPEGFKFAGSLNLTLPLAWEDKWIISRLSSFAKKANDAFAAYEFANATTASYNFFLYELCDVYLELLKPRFQSEAASEEVKRDREAACNVLYLCLDWSLRLMHPLLPFLTEELYQRLPPSPCKEESVCIARYPTHVIAWENAAVEKEMEMLSEIAKQMRSEKTSLGLSPGARPRGFVKHSDPEVAKVLQSLTTRLGRMSLIGEVQVTDSTPEGTVQAVVNKECLIFIEVAGLDLSQQLGRLEKQLKSLDSTIASYEKKMAAPGYEEKVPLPVRQMNQEKLTAAHQEREECQRASIMIHQAMKK